MEARIEKPICTWAEEDGWHVRKLGYPGRKFAPDRWFLKDGRHVHIEFKDEGRPPEIGQERERKRINDHGGEAYFCDNITDAVRILGLIWPRPKSKR